MQEAVLSETLKEVEKMLNSPGHRVDFSSEDYNRWYQSFLSEIETPESQKTEVNNSPSGSRGRISKQKGNNSADEKKERKRENDRRYRRNKKKEHEWLKTMLLQHEWLKTMLLQLSHVIDALIPQQAGINMSLTQQQIHGIFWLRQLCTEIAEKLGLPQRK